MAIFVLSRFGSTRRRSNFCKGGGKNVILLIFCTHFFSAVFTWSQALKISDPPEDQAIFRFLGKPGPQKRFFGTLCWQGSGSHSSQCNECFLVECASKKTTAQRMIRRKKNNINDYSIWSPYSGALLGYQKSFQIRMKVEINWKYISAKIITDWYFLWELFKVLI